MPLHIGFSAIKDHALDDEFHTLCRSTARIVSRCELTPKNKDAVTCVKCLQKLKRLGLPKEATK